jgi:tRNA wybutosine-synthesizing protein 1
MIKNGWEKVSQSLDLAESLSCRTVVRLTAVKNLNLSEKYIEDYIKIVEKVNPNFFEIKGFTLQARALNIKERLKSDKPIQYYFPTYEYLEEIALKFEEVGNFPLIYKNRASRDFLFAIDWDKNKDPVITNP